MDGPPTHWKQTIFYLEDNILVKINEKIRGNFSLRQNPANNRQLDFAIELELEGYYMKHRKMRYFALR